WTRSSAPRANSWPPRSATPRRSSSRPLAGR
ncbi:MAG: hypothetical protein AVDCRST_MAG12-307, partial [uncultured Rubrobacteraceae bacterium]